MKEINIGIIGGCMTCQTDLKLSQLFYRKLSKELLDKDDIKCFVSLRYYNEYFRIPEKADHLVKNAKPATIILQVRPAPFIMRSELMIQDYKGRYIINPLVFSHKNIERIENILGTKDPIVLNPYKIKGHLKRLTIKKILHRNTSLGNIFGLKRKAQKSLDEYIIYLQNLCAKNNIHLIIIGTLNSYSYERNELLSEMNNSLKKLTESRGINYLDVFSLVNDDKDRYFGTDKFHLNEEGHALVAGLLYEQMRHQASIAETA